MKIIYVIMSKYVKFNLQFNYIDLTLNKLFFSQEDMDVDFFSILTLLGGVGLFLFGMNMMGDSLKNLAGGSLERILEKLTTGKSQATGAIKGFGLGTLSDLSAFASITADPMAPYRWQVPEVNRSAD